MSGVVLTQSALTDDIARRETGAEPIQCTVSYEPTSRECVIPTTKEPSRQPETFPTTRDLPDNKGPSRQSNFPRNQTTPLPAPKNQGFHKRTKGFYCRYELLSNGGGIGGLANACRPRTDELRLLGSGLIGAPAAIRRRRKI